MKLCSICHKNIATIFVSKIVDGKPEMQGLCIECANKMGMPVIDQLMEQTGMSKDQVESLTKQMKDMMEGIDIEELANNDLFSNLSDLSEGMFPFMKDKDDDLEGEDLDLENEDDLVLDKNEFNDKNDKNTAQVEYDLKRKSRAKGFRNKRKHLDKYGINLTDKAKNNEVDKIVGRDKEIDRVIQILNRRAKNNPILIGEPGVGKTAIAEGLAVKIVEGEVPHKLLNAEIYLLDLTAIVAGTQFRGQFEGRMKSIIKEAKENENIILIIDEVHNIMGAGEVQGGAMNAANILKPALAKGEIQLIGATTLEEYRKHIEKDSALDRRFQPVLVEEPTPEETIEILKGIKKYYEDYHRVKISDEVVEAAVKLSQKYITDRFLPDKAIDVIDEAGSRANLNNKKLTELEKLKVKLDEVKKDELLAAQEDNFEKVAQFKMESCKVEEDIRNIEENDNEPQISIEDIAYVIEAWTKIPVQKITEEEAQKLLNLETTLHKRVVGQNNAIVSLAKTIRRNRSGFRKKKKPASFIFVGPTGVGKTELVKALAEELFGSQDAMIRIDMSEYMEKHAVSKLIGAPPGYVGYDQGGQLTEKIRRKPYSVILLDEIEKAHPDVFNMLLQILEDGRLTDSQGRTAFFENSVIIMTSNAGTNFKASSIGFTKEGYAEIESGVKEALRETFRPEFLNRVDEVVVFDKLSKDELLKIVELMIDEVVEEVNDKDMSIEVSDEVKEFILKKGYDDKYGARPLRRTIQKYIEDEMAELYLQGKLKKGSKLNLELVDDEVVVK